MGKKKQMKKAYRTLIELGFVPPAGWTLPPAAPGWGAPWCLPVAGANAAPSQHGAADTASDSGAATPAANLLGIPGTSGLTGWLGNLSQTQQFLLGALLGGGATWVASDEALRGKIAKAAMKLYADVAGNMAEFKEQLADLKAEMEAGGGEG